jgi:hypothetical protein
VLVCVDDHLERARVVVHHQARYVWKEVISTKARHRHEIIHHSLEIKIWTHGCVVLFHFPAVTTAVTNAVTTASTAVAPARLFCGPGVPDRIPVTVAAIALVIATFATRGACAIGATPQRGGCILRGGSGEEVGKLKVEAFAEGGYIHHL